MKALKIVFIGIIISVFCAGQAYCAPKGNNGKGSNGNTKNGNSNKSNANANNSKANNAKTPAAKANRGNNHSASQTKGQSAVHKQQARRYSEANRKREERNRSAQHKPNFDNIKNNDLAFNTKHNKRANNARRNGHEMKNEKTLRALDLIDSLKRVRWSHNPRDIRGQGNMGKVDMLDPYGHDKDSDSKELYGNNGRPIRESEEIPTLEVLFSVDFSSLEDYEDWLVNWMQRAIDEYWTNELRQKSYTFEEWEKMYRDHFFVRTDTSTGIIVNQRETMDYSLDFSGTEGTYEITTQLVSLENYDSLIPVYNSETGTREEIYYDIGEVIYENTQELTFNSESSSYEFSVDLPTELTSSASSLYTELQVTVTNTITGDSHTQTYDKSIYLFRCPYGKVFDSNTNSPIVNAKITIHFEDGSIVSLDKATNKTANNPQITDATGRFGFILQSNRKYYLTATAEGYEDYQSGVFTEQWHVLREDIEMVPAQEQIASNLER